MDGVSPDRVELSPVDAAELGQSLFKAGKFSEAFDVFASIADVQPDNWEAAHHAAYALMAQRKWSESLEWYDRAAAISVTQLNQTALNKSEALGEAGRSEEAIHMLRNGILRQYPNHAKAHYNLGVLLMQVQEFEQALRHFEICSHLDPAATGGNWRYCQGFAHLVLGDYLKGFEGFRDRLKEPSKVGPMQGHELSPNGPSINGSTVLILSATGRGDVIQFGRYIPMLVECGANVSIVADRGLEALFAGMPGVTIFAESDILPPSDYWCEIMDLANVFQTTVDTVPPPLPLTFDDELLTKWRKRIPDDGVLNVGLCWAGNPESRYDEHRSIPVHMLFALVNPLLETDRVRFYNLQQSIRESDQLAYDHLFVHDIGPDFKDYRDTAHAMKCLDLVITVDTSIAHMAGTVGVNTWIMTTLFRTYWLWLKGRTDTPWYPSVELIRQPIHGNWPSAIAVVRDRLLGMLAV